MHIKDNIKGHICQKYHSRFRDIIESQDHFRWSEMTKMCPEHHRCVREIIDVSEITKMCQRYHRCVGHIKYVSHIPQSFRDPTYMSDILQKCQTNHSRIRDTARMSGTQRTGPGQHKMSGKSMTLEGHQGPLKDTRCVSQQMCQKQHRYLSDTRYL